MSFQTCKTFIHLQNTNEDIFDEIWDVSEPAIDRNVFATFKAQKGSKNIV